MNNKKLVLLSVLHALGVLAYISLLALFLNKAAKIFGPVDTILAPIIMLMLFVLSALITGSLVLGRPIILYFDGKRNEAIKLLIYTAVSLLALLAIVILVYLGLR